MINKRGVFFLVLIFIILSAAVLSLKEYRSYNNRKKSQTEYFLEKLTIRDEHFYLDEDYKDEILASIELIRDDISTGASSKVEEVISPETIERLYYLQIGTFRNKTNADNLMKSLRDIARLRIVQSEHNERYYILITEDYKKEDLDSINKEIRNRYKSISPIVKVRY